MSLRRALATLAAGLLAGCASLVHEGVYFHVGASTVYSFDAEDMLRQNPQAPEPPPMPGECEEEECDDGS